MKKEVSIVRKKIDYVNKELKPLGRIRQKKEREYKEALDTFNEKEQRKSTTHYKIDGGLAYELQKYYSRPLDCEAAQMVIEN
ncbi:transcriptional activator DUF662 [Tanacetum coccineum]|uniref:RAB6-interacting golgin n=1 Tax=Tanacetum coccineum TaxID=301880 RepID=A0ABQ4YKQ4_9ASTR